MAKKIQISDDAGVNYYTLPGSTGELQRELSNFNDTVFGQDWQSEDVSLGMWNVNCNSRFKGLAGYTALLKSGGTPVVMTAEPCSLVSGKTYRITASAKRVISYADTLTVLDNAVDHTADVLNIDYLDGTVTFKAAYNPVGPVTVTGKYVPMATLAKFRNFTINQTAAEIEDTAYEVAQANGGWKTHSLGLKTVGLELGGIYDVTSAYEAALAARTLMYVEISPPSDSLTFFRGFFKRTGFGQSGEVGALEESSLKLSLFVPDGSLVLTPFSWYYPAGSTLNTAVKKAIQAWQNNTALKVRYSPTTGTTGTEGSVIVTECSMSNDIAGQNEFKFSFRGTGAPVAY